MKVQHLLLLALAAILILAYGDHSPSPLATNSAPVLAAPAPQPIASRPDLTTTPTPNPDPEFAILQYVINTHPNWNCQGPTGTPGHRQITNCGPYGNPTHPTSGYVDNYGNASVARAEWNNRRTLAQSLYPRVTDMPYNGYAGYHANNTAFPNAHYEEYYVGSVWVLGAVSSDDTQFWGGPYVARAMMDAAAALGYLPGGGITPTITPTPPPCCNGLSASGAAACIVGGNYDYNFSVDNACFGNVFGTVTVYRELSASPTGPWTVYDSQGPTLMTFPAGSTTIINNHFAPGPVPPQYQWWRVRLHFEQYCPPPLDFVTGAQPVCATGATGTPSLPTGTPTATPTPACCNGLSASGASACILGGYYDYGFSASNTCPNAIVGGVSVYMEVSANPNGPWTGYTGVGPYTQNFPTGSTYISNHFSPGSIPLQYNWWRARLHIEYGCPPPVDFATAPNAICESRPSVTPTPPTTTPTWTPSGPPTFTITPTATGTPPTPGPITFNDVPPGSTFYAYVQWMACRGTVGGYPCGGAGEPCPGTYYRPNNNVTRGQLAKIVANTAQYSETPTGQTFEDVPPASTFYPWIEQIASRGIVAGYPCGGAFEPCVPPSNRPYFRPNNATTRGQIAKVVAEARGYTDPITTQSFEDVPPNSTFYLYVERLAGRGILGGYPCGGPFEPCVGPGNRPYFRPNNPATRGQLAKIATLAYGGP